MTPFSQHRTFDRPLYLVFRDFGTHGIESVTEPSDTRASIVRDIANGQIDRVVSVIEIADGMSEDITDTIRDAVALLLSEREAA